MIKHPMFVILSSILCVVAGFLMKSSYIEIVASIVGIINVWFLARQNVINFFFGIITVACFMYIYFQTGLYAMVILSFIQLLFNVYGWYYWVKNKGEEDVLPTKILSVQGKFIWGGVILIGTMVWAFFQIQYTDAASPYLDSLVAVMGLVGQYLLSKKLLDNWYLWIAMNIILTIVYATTGLYVMIILSLINLLISIDGMLEWKRNYEQHQEKSVGLDQLERM
ncbi:nicotinamide riboside transporter PnuC [Bacillus sp. 1P06AnD]|uniref:nicotinamide riboside transporter PnuC n=1 Tax=Bacillus sp. 1P06AnD TaxID=3132208 RepID=UPI0039A0C2A2